MLRLPRCGDHELLPPPCQIVQQQQCLVTVVPLPWWVTNNQDPPFLLFHRHSWLMIDHCATNLTIAESYGLAAPLLEQSKANLLGWSLRMTTENSSSGDGSPSLSPWGQIFLHHHPHDHRRGLSFPIPVLERGIHPRGDPCPHSNDTTIENYYHRKVQEREKLNTMRFQ